MTGRKATSWEVPSWFAGIKGPADGDVHHPRINSTMIDQSIRAQAIAARMALIVGAASFDRLFAGVRFDEVVMDILFVYAKRGDSV